MPNPDLHLYCWDRPARDATRELATIRTMPPLSSPCSPRLRPASAQVSQLVDLLNCGMSVARFNFSHGSHEYHYETLMNLREACNITGKICATLLDTKGAYLRPTPPLFPVLHCFFFRSVFPLQHSKGSVRPAII